MLDLEKKELMERLMKEYLEQEKQKRESMKKKILFTNR